MIVLHTWSVCRNDSSPLFCSRSPCGHTRSYGSRGFPKYGISRSLKLRTKLRDRVSSRGVFGTHRKESVVLMAGLKVMIAGAPAAGKGTQCEKIVAEYGLVHISVGDLLRAEVAAGTEAGTRAKSFMDSGDLVPNEVVVDMVKNRLAQPDVQENGWLLDGYPRSAEQAEAIESENIRPDLFILIDVVDEALVERVVGRRLDPVTGAIYHLKFKPPPAEILSRLTQRSDDTEDKVRNRLATYHKNLDSVLGYYQQVLVRVDGNQSMDEVFEQVAQNIDRAASHDELAAVA